MRLARRLLAIGAVYLMTASAILLARDAGAQSPSQQPSTTTLVGTWHGTSKCLVRPSACNDEVVVYRIAPTKAADTLTVDGRKIVGAIR